MLKILIAVDGSERADHAIEAVAHIPVPVLLAK